MERTYKNIHISNGTQTDSMIFPKLLSHEEIVYHLTVEHSLSREQIN